MNGTKKRIVLVGGGSGGHFYPLIAVAESLRATRPEIQIFYMGPKPYDEEALARLNITFISCPAGKQRRYRSIRNFFDKFRVLYGTGVACLKLLWVYPDAIFSKGGYTSVPVILAGGFLRIPIVIHESDAVPGRANKIAASFAKYIAIFYDDVAKFFPEKKTAQVGIPTRKIFFEPVDSRAPAELGIDANRPMIFVTGGSQGAERINNLVLNSLDELLPHYTIFHQTGSSHAALVQQTAIGLIPNSELLNRYHVRGHVSGKEFSQALSLAALVITRGGSTTINEIALTGKPAIIIPIPEGISHDQRTNAYAYARSGGASVIEEHNLTDNLLTAEITRIMSDTNLYQEMCQKALAFAPTDAAEKVATVLLEITDSH